MTGKEKVERYALALELNKPGQPTLTVENLALIKDLIAKWYPPLWVGQAWAMIDKGN